MCMTGSTPLPFLIWCEHTAWSQEERNRLNWHQHKILLGLYSAHSKTKQTRWLNQHRLHRLPKEKQSHSKSRTEQKILPCTLQTATISELQQDHEIWCKNRTVSRPALEQEPLVSIGFAITAHPTPTSLFHINQTGQQDFLEQVP